ncbi:MAG TPA: formate dehydrogenase accessory protein FdhE [Gemmatimonadales bacterium]|nr:formate dehydrogenase accessory protein FdhE [Gemmatimonadales bacterium]
MHGTTRGLRTESVRRLTELGRQRPEWKAWLGLLVESDRAMDEADRGTPCAEVEPDAAAAHVPDGTPLLHGRALAIDAVRSQRLVGRLAALASAGDLQGAASLRDYHPSPAAALELLQTAVRRDQAGMDRLAEAARVDAGALAAVADLAALPPLQSCGRQLEARAPRHWPHGYCPICASGPVLVEQRGLDRSRWARCGRCGGQWQAQWLCCIYCGEREHERLGSLVPEEGGEVLRVETCASCRGYLKSVTTLQPLPPFELLLRDLETVELDLVALDRGYCRPADGGFALDVRIVARASGPGRRQLADG